MHQPIVSTAFLPFKFQDQCSLFGSDTKLTRVGLKQLLLNFIKGLSRFAVICAWGYNVPFVNFPLWSFSNRNHFFFMVSSHAVHYTFIRVKIDFKANFSLWFSTTKYGIKRIIWKGNYFCWPKFSHMKRNWSCG